MGLRPNLIRWCTAAVLLTSTSLAEVAPDPRLEPPPPAPHVLRGWQDAVQRFRAGSADIGRAATQVGTAQGQARAAWAGALPRLSASGQLNHHLLTGTTVDQDGNTVTLPNPQTILGASATLNVPILALKTWYDARTADLQVNKIELDKSSAERAGLEQLAGTLLSVVTTERLAEVSRIGLRAALATLQLTQTKLDLGSATPLDVIRAEQEVAKSRAQIDTADENLNQARETLGLLLGESEAWGVAPDIKLDELEKDALKSCTLGKSVRDRADVQAALAGEELASRTTKGLTYEYFPTIEANTQLNYSSFARFSTNGSNTTWTIGATLTWNLYDGGRRYAVARQNSAALTAAQITSNETTRKAIVAVRQAARAVRKAEAALELATRQRQLSAQAYDLARARYESGSGTSLELVDAQRLTREAEVDVAVKEFEVTKAQMGAFLTLASCDI